ncbi:isoaspartyl peptidase/L-asparaginase [Cellulomonas fengjieae]|uniref:isoaspartyl peptidase/L-asparaginase n=1 Tax=Cellulomonas fengjieae TaxID=2819978 RepID=UPI001AAEE39E|nr:isoaspartyl peptidase/L-asparaginase [Cellulomonas fengjieae]MBO3103713.1 isoaspartyl peptidase/L-asparaginase [Cellulomonas fengjieae]
MTQEFDLPGELPVAVAHGGVDMEPTPATFATLEQSTGVAFALLADGRPGIEAALGAVAVLEDDPAFNAGYGSVLTRTGQVETDGAVSDGFTGRSAGVGAVPGVRHPAAVAYGVLQGRDTVLLAGPAAADYARTIGHSPEDLVVEEQVQALARMQPGDQQSAFTGRRVPSETVGCLTITADGRIASVSSTGGLMGKPSGRIGDACIPGAGFWTDRRFGVLCSGSGEAALRRQLASEVARRAGHSGLLAALTDTLTEAARTPGTIGAIVAIDLDERKVATIHNGASFPVVVRHAGGPFRLGAADARLWDQVGAR